MHDLEYKRIDRGTLTRLQKLYNESNKHRDALRRKISHIASWLSLAESKLSLLDRIFLALDAYRKKKPQALILEALCIWIGPDEKRPSHWLETKAIHKWLQQNGEAKLPGKRLAAVVLGKRDHECQLHNSHLTWWRYGSLLDQLPAGIVALLKGGNQKHLQQLLTRCPQINSKPAVLAVFDYLWMKPDGDIMQLLEALPVVIGAFRKSLRHTEKSKNEFLEFLQTAMEYPFAKRIIPHNQPMKWVGIDEAFIGILEANFISRLKLDKRNLSLQNFQVDPFMAASIYILGIRPPLVWKKQFHVLKSESLVQMNDWFIAGIQLMLLDSIQKPDRRLESVACSIFGTYAAITDCENTALAFAEWLDAACHFWAPGKSGQRHIEYALYHLYQWIREANYQQQNMIRLNEILNTHSRKIYTDQQRTIGDETKLSPERFILDALHPTAALAKLGDLSSQQCRFVVNKHLFSYAIEFQKRNSTRLVACIPLLQKRGWLLRWWKTHTPVTVYEVFKEAKDVLKMMIDWCDSIHRNEGFDEHLTGSMFSVVTYWCFGEYRSITSPGCLEFLMKNPWFLKNLSQVSLTYKKIVEQKKDVNWTGFQNAVSSYDLLIVIGIEWEKNGW